MENAKQQFAARLREAMERAGYNPKPALLEREFNLRWHGRPMTLHGVRRWLLGEAIPGQDKIVTLAEWLKISPQTLRYGGEVERRIDERTSWWDEVFRSQECDVVTAYLELPQEQRQALRRIILALADRKNEGAGA